MFRKLEQFLINLCFWFKVPMCCLNILETLFKQLFICHARRMLHLIPDVII